MNQLHNMDKTKIVKKYLSNEDINKHWDLLNHYWIQVKEKWLKLKLTNKKQFMKRWTDRKINIMIAEVLSPREEIFLNRCWFYIDDENEINLVKLSEDYKYSASLLSQLKKWLIDKWFMKKKWKLFYLSPLIWIKTKEIDQDLIRLFQDTFERYWVEIK